VAGGTNPASVDVQVRGVRLHYLQWGDRRDPPVLFIHGAGMLAHAWDPIVAGILPGWRLLAPDLRGHGRSGWATPPHYRIEDFGEDLLALLDAVGIESTTLVGHSMGGRVAAWLAAEQPARVRALGLMDTRLTALSHEKVQVWRGVRAGRGARRGHASRAAAMASFRITPEEPGITARVRDQLAYHAVREHAPGEWALCFDRAVLHLEGSRIADLTGLLRRIRCPTLIMRGERSGVLDEKKCAAMAAVLTDCRVEVFSGGHHFPLAHPDRVAAALRAFLSSLTV